MFLDKLCHRLTSNLRSCCLNLQRTGITDMYHHACLRYNFFRSLLSIFEFLDAESRVIKDYMYVLHFQSFKTTVFKYYKHPIHIRICSGILKLFIQPFPSNGYKMVFFIYFEMLEMDPRASHIQGMYVCALPSSS